MSDPASVFELTYAALCDISEVLDGKDINDTARQFLKNWHANKEERKKRKEMMGRSRDGSLFPMGGSVGKFA